MNLDQNDDPEFEVDDGSFDDFGDTGTEKKKGIPKIAVIIGVILVVVFMIFLFGGSKEEVANSVVRGGSDVKQDVGTQELDPTMLEATETLNEDNRIVAEDTGGSFIPIPTIASQSSLEDLVEEEEEEDPLETWKSLQTERMKQEQFERQVKEAELKLQAENETQNTRSQAVSQLANAMSVNMSEIIAGKQIKPLTHVNVTDVKQFYERLNPPVDPTTAAALEGNQGSEEEATAVQIIAATTIEYGQTLIEANSDVKGPVLVELVTGPLKGARLLGSFKKEEEYLVIEMNTAVKDEKSYSVNAIILDPDTTLPGVATEVDRRWFRRVILPAAASFIEGLGSAIAETSGTSVSVEGETVTTQTEDLDTEEELGKAVEKAAEKIAEIVDDEAADVETLVKVRAGTPVGILFLAPVFEELENVPGVPATTNNASTGGSSGNPAIPQTLLDVPGLSGIPLDVIEESLNQ